MATLDRPLDRAEAFFWLLDRCSSMNFAVLAEGSGPLSASKVEASLAGAQRRHPALGCAIDADAAGRLAFVPRAGAAIGLHREAAGDAWRDALARRLTEPFALGGAPLVRAHWFERDGGRWAFAVVFHHSIGDGRSGMRLVREVIEEACGAREPGPAVAPRPSLIQGVPAELAGEAGAVRALAWRDQLRRQPLRPETVPGFTREGADGRPGIVPICLEAEVVETLGRRAREQGCSVHGAIGAAQLLAERELFEGPEERALMLTSPVDLRGRLSMPMDDATPGFYVTLLSTIVAVKGRGDLWPLAQHLSRDLRRQVDEGCGHLFYQLVPPAETLGAGTEAIAGFRAYMQRMPTACVLSNVGRIAPAQEAGGVRVDEISFALCPMAHQPLFAAATTCGGRLYVNVVHDAGRFAPAAARGIARAMERLLREAAA
jgi:hypothetical protein